MNWNISAWSIRNPVPPILLFFVLCVLGYQSFNRLAVTKFPNIDVPVVSVVVADAGVAPSELETQVTKRVEDAVSNITGVDKVISTVTESISTTVVQFRLEVDTQTAVNDVKDAIERIAGDLPGSADEPIINRIDVEGAAILTYAVSAPAKTLEELSWFVDDVVVRTMQGVKGVARVDRYGGVTREITIEIDPDRLIALGVTAADINNALRANNIDLTGGRSEIGSRQQAIRTLGSAQTLSDLENLRVPLPGGRRVLLSDVATVRDGFEEPVSFARVNGVEVVSFAVFRAKGQSDVEVKARIDTAVQALLEQYPEVAINKVDDPVRYTAGNYTSAMSTLLEGAGLAVVVVLLFLRDLRATIITAIALPLSIVPTFWALEVLGFSLNLVSLLGITLVTGILVDDAIVEIENIVRHIKMGKSPYRASLEAADEIGLAVIAISATIIAVFTPVSFMDGIAGQYFKQFGLTVAVAVFFSLLVARLITPMMAAYLMRSHGHPDEKEGVLTRAYTWFLGWTLRLRWLTLATGIAFFAGSVFAMGLLPAGFVPVPDASRIVASLELPPGTRLEGTRQTTDQAAELIGEIEGVNNVYVVGGASPKGTLEVRLATIIVDLIHKSEREITQGQIEDKILATLNGVPDLRFHFVNDRNERNIEVGIVGDDGALVDVEARKILKEMAESGRFKSTSSNAALDRPEILFEPRRDKIAEMGISTASIAEALRVATLGDVEENLAKFTIGDRQIPIRVKLKGTARENLATIRNLPVPLPTGGSVPLSAVSEIRFAQGPTSIERFDRQRRVVIGTDMAGGEDIGVGIGLIKGLPTVENLAPGVSLAETGDAEIMAEVFDGFRIAMITGIMLVFVVLILLFGSVFHTFTILVSLPLSLGGVVAGLWLTGFSVSMPVVIGMLMLMGIVTKNAIMLVDFAVEEVKHGVPRAEAIIDAGRKRARPIIMTTIAMSAGMLPAAWGVGDGGEFRAPMAVAVIGGLIVSTVLSLLFVPSVYTIMDDLSRLSGRFMYWLLNPNKADEPDVIEFPDASTSGNSKLDEKPYPVAAE